MDNIIIPNPESLNKKIALMKKDGKEKLHILSDFDRTITKAFTNGKKIPSLIYHLRSENYLSEEYSKKAHALYDKYHPIEISTTINPEEKSEKMKEWWFTHYKLLVESGLNKETIARSMKEIVINNAIELRGSIEPFFKELDNKNIPLIILSSSGVGNMIIELLKNFKVMNSNIHFVGNTLEFDKEGKFTGVKGNRIIHSFNKHEAELKGLPIYKELLKRKNVILLGDSLGDLKMIEGFSHENLIKIAFFNFPDEENIEDYKQNFDIIITNDGDFSEVNKILEQII